MSIRSLGQIIKPVCCIPRIFMGYFFLPQDSGGGSAEGLTAS